MGDKRGDQQARSELLGKLMASAGFQPYMLRHGSGREQYYLVLLRLSDEELTALDAAVGEPVLRVKAGPNTMVAFPLEANVRIGAVDARYYNAAEQRWTGTIALSRFQ